jgi:septum formation protein
LKLDAAVIRLKQRNLPNGLVLCADTTVSLGAKIFGKPNSAQEAVEMLSELSGKTHRVLTAVAVQWGPQRLAALSISHVEFMHMAAGELERYVATGEPIGKAGAYALQGLAARYVVKIRGSHSGIVGLPIFETAQLLRQLGWQL